MWWKRLDYINFVVGAARVRCVKFRLSAQIEYSIRVQTAPFSVD